MNEERCPKTNCTAEYGQSFEKQSGGHALNGNWVVLFYPKHIAIAERKLFLQGLLSRPECLSEERADCLRN